MTERSYSDGTRRRFLMLVGGGAIALPLAGLSACGSKESAPATPSGSPAPAAAPAAPAAEAPVAEAPASAAPAAEPAAQSAVPAELPRVSESEALAVALGYRHDATQVDRAKYPRYEVGQLCRNCIQWKGSDTDEWGPCGIFPGKLVNANGWCSTYARRG